MLLKAISKIRFYYHSQVGLAVEGVSMLGKDLINSLSTAIFRTEGKTCFIIYLNT